MATHSNIIVILYIINVVACINHLCSYRDTTHIMQANGDNESSSRKSKNSLFIFNDVTSYWEMAKTKANRDRGEIIALILEAAIEPATRSKLMYGAMLNFRQITDYLPSIIDAGLLRHFPENKTYVVSEKGRKYLELYGKRSALLRLA